MLRSLACGLATLVAACGSEDEAARQYPGPWKNEAKAELVSLMVSSQVKDCAEFWWRTRDGNEGRFAEYLVYCSSDGKEWKSWLLWPGIGKALGPSDVLAGLPLPKHR